MNLDNLFDIIFSGETTMDSHRIQMQKYLLRQLKSMQATTDQTQKMDIIQVILLYFEMMTGAMCAMIICDDEAEIVEMVMVDDIL